MTDRDPMNPAILGAAVATWMMTQDDEADITLETVLLAQGVISPADTVEAIEYYAPYSVLILLDDGAEISINTGGRVNCC